MSDYLWAGSTGTPSRYLVSHPPTQVNSAWPSLRGRQNEYQLKWEVKCLVSDCGDQRRRMSPCGSGRTLTFLVFTLPRLRAEVRIYGYVYAVASVPPKQPDSFSPPQKCQTLCCLTVILWKYQVFVGNTVTSHHGRSHWTARIF